MINFMVMIIIAVCAVLASSYIYFLLQMFLTITKCPECGRIMQKVLYTESSEEKSYQIHYECRFCQGKRIRPIHRGKKLTMYP
ncbi:hypothetical protein DNHGIG_02860 [Collibacillus ludicampi]|uniref:Uncharacterized protein n=1 Tax=Collibacillus ludicampi TaxID=2771369 RepID=A0AAV4LA93_9BACL|nr:hypothetical protein [Collibacillus ludicampi]GIM44737.1 hypothetical protein DNHGIG_02860 [Collibacillus ludicampi]